jgi:hypothetical protein
MHYEVNLYIIALHVHRRGTTAALHVTLKFEDPASLIRVPISSISGQLSSSD